MYIYVCMYEERMRGTQASLSTQCFPTDVSFAFQGHQEQKKGSMETSHQCADAGEGSSSCGEQLLGREERVDLPVCAALGWGTKLSFFTES